MAFDPKRLRRWFAISGIALLVVVIGFYSYARYRVNRLIKEVPQKVGIEVQQSTTGFTFTKSIGGRKQFSISAGKAVQLKAGQRSILNDVRIIVYGRGATDESNSDVYDQIYGREFAYDPTSGEVTAKGEVHIDLQRHGTPNDDPSQDADEPGSVHLKTSGLSFNQKTGIAQTKERIEFSIPQASGSAVGALYNSEDRTLTLQSQVRIQAAADASQHSAVNMNAASVTASKAVITDAPRKIDLTAFHLEQNGRDFDAQNVEIFLRGDSSVERAIATGDVRASMPADGDTGRTRLQARSAGFDFGAKNALRNIVLNGEVTFDATGKSPMQGSAGKVVVDFSGRNRANKVRATHNVNFQQRGASTTALRADAMDFFLRARGGIERATTAGTSQIVLTQGTQTTTVTADQFDARFAPGNRIASLHGEPNARVRFGGATPHSSTSRAVTAKFDTRSARAALQSVDQVGDFEYSEGTRTASAERARYTPADELITLNGSPRVQDKQSGLALTANTVRLNRRTGEASAEGEVKTTFTQLKANQAGALLATAEPVHVTSTSARASNSGQARFSGAARLWQGANIIQAPVIEFDRDKRWLQASTGAGNAQVITVFAQTDRAGRTTPVTVRAGKLTYSDLDRTAHYEKGVTVRTADGTLNAQNVIVLLHPAGQSNAAGGVSQVEQIIATGNLVFEQQNPARKAAGERLVYTASDGKFVLSGTSAKPPSIFDAERGEITGDSLTFHSRDDRVQVSSGENSRTVTKTRIKDETRP
jgi:lipopolysaccharide export system protein LptA